MFTVEQIEQAHSKVKSGADFPKYIQEIKRLGVTGFETRVKDSRTEYFGSYGYKTTSTPMYDDLMIAATSDKEAFEQHLKIHQRGETDYFEFCRDCAATGVEKWVLNLDEMTCIYYDMAGNSILKESIPQ